MEQAEGGQRKGREKSKVGGRKRRGRRGEENARRNSLTFLSL